VVARIAVARTVVARIVVARIVVARIVVARIVVRLNCKMTGSRRIPLRRDCNTITPPMPTRGCMPTRDGKVIILEKWEGGFGQVNPYEIHLLQSHVAAGFA
jgi:hypothetical protein